MRELIQEKSLKTENVAKALYSVQVLLNIREFVLERNVTSVEKVAKPIIGIQVLLNLRIYTEDKAYK